MPHTTLASPTRIAKNVYKILTQAQWQAFEHQGFFDGSPDDVRDGFIHLSFFEQLEGTLAKHYAHHAEALALVTLDALRLSTGLKFEPSRGGLLFPHYYGRLLLSNVLNKQILVKRGDGTVLLPQPQTE